MILATVYSPMFGELSACWIPVQSLILHFFCQQSLMKSFQRVLWIPFTLLTPRKYKSVSFTGQLYFVGKSTLVSFPLKISYSILPVLWKRWKDTYLIWVFHDVINLFLPLSAPVIYFSLLKSAISCILPIVEAVFLCLLHLPSPPTPHKNREKPRLEGSSENYLSPPTVDSRGLD